MGLGSLFSAGHALIRSIEPDESWAYCFVDEVLMPDPAEDAAAR